MKKILIVAMIFLFAGCESMRDHDRHDRDRHDNDRHENQGPVQGHERNEH